jgi:DNA-binding XRE family transcriptional regulator
MRRPTEHLSHSHSNKIKEWVKDINILGLNPIVEILEEVKEFSDIDVRERFWISKCIDDGCVLLNENLVIPATIRPDLDILINEDNSNGYLEISRFVSERRKLIGITQENFANKTCIALTVLRKIEQGKSNINLKSLLDVLIMFGYTITLKKIYNE